MSTQVGVYCRISRDTVGGGLGVKRQREDCEALAKRRRWRVAAVYTDNDISAYGTKRRPEYERMLGDLNAGTISGVVAWHPDRLHRSTRELDDFIDVIEATQAVVATVGSGDYDLSTASGRMTARVLGAVARGESEHKAERQRRKNVELAENGKPPGGPPPFGYDKSRDPATGASRLTINEGEAAVVGEAASRVLSGEPLYAVARDFQSRGVPTKRGAAWTSVAIRQNLLRPAIAGLRVHKGRVVGEAAWPAIIDANTRARLVNLLGDRSRYRRGMAGVNLLTGLARCGRCSARLNGGRTEVGRRVYRCCSCRGISISADDLDAVISALVRRWLADGVPAAKASSDGNGSEAKLSTEIANADAKLSELASRWAADAITSGEWTAARQALETRRDGARRQLARLHEIEVLDTVPTDIEAKWDDLGVDRHRAIIHVMVEEITVAPSRIRGRHSFDPERISVTKKVR